MRNSIQSVERVLSILTAFNHEAQKVSVTGLAISLGVHKSTASRLVSALLRSGFLECGPEGKSLRLGPEIARLGLLALGGRTLVSLSQEVMERLSQQSGETVNLAVLDGTEVVNIAQVEGTHIVGVGMWTGRRTKLHCVANGKLLAAWSSSDLIRPPLERYTANTITDLDELRAQLEEVRRRGWAWNIGELEEGLHAVAAPVFDGFDNCRAALSVSGPSYRMPVERLPEAAELCLKAAREISHRLGKR